MLKAILVQCLADCAHPSIHHIRGTHHVSTRSGMRYGRLCQKLQGMVVINIATCNDTTVPVIGVFTQTDIGEHH